MGVTTAKPSSFSLNSGASYYPDHLWMINEGTGTTCEDLVGTWDLTITGADWGTDGTHGPILTFLSSEANNRASYLSASFGGAFSWGMILDIASAPGSAQVFFSAGDAAADTNLGTGTTSAGLPQRRTKLAGSATTGNSAGDIVADTGFSIIFGKGSDSNVSSALNDGAFGNSAHSSSGLVASLDQISFGCERDSSAGLFADMVLCAAWIKEGAEYSDADLDAIFNSGNPWPMLGVDPPGGSSTRKRRTSLMGIG